MQNRFLILLFLFLFLPFLPGGANGRGIYKNFFQNISPATSGSSVQSKVLKDTLLIMLAQQRLMKKAPVLNYVLPPREKKTVGFWELYLSEDYAKAADAVSDDILNSYTLYAACRSLYIVDDKKRLSDYLDRFTKKAESDPQIKMVVLMVRAYLQDNLNKSEKTQLIKKADSILVENNLGYFKYRIEELYARSAADRTEAIKYYSKALDLAQQAGYDLDVVRYLNSLADIYRTIDNMHSSLVCLDKAEKILAKYNCPRSYPTLYRKKAILYSYMQNFQLARIYIDKALQYNPDDEFLNLEKAVIFQDMGLHNEAVNQLSSYLKKDMPFPIVAYYTLLKGENYAQLGQFDKAVAEYNNALSVCLEWGNSYYKNQCFLDKARAFLKLDQADSVQACLAIIAGDSSTFQTPDQAMDFFDTKALFHFQYDNLDSSIVYYKKALYMLEQIREKITVSDLRIGYFNKNIQIQRNLVRCFAHKYLDSPDPANVDSAFVYYLSSKNKSNRDILRQTINDTAMHDFLESKNRLSSLQRRNRLNIEHSFIIDETLLNNIKSEQFNLLNKRNLLSDNVVARQKTELPSLKPDETLLGYLIFDNESFVLIRNNALKNIIGLNINENDLEQEVKQLLESLHNFKEIDDVKFNATVAFHLYKEIFEPLDRQELLTRNILLIPDKFLYGLPLDMLLTSNPSRDSYSVYDLADYTGSFLLNKYNFSSYVAIAGSVKEKDQNNSVLIVSNPFDPSSVAKDKEDRTYFRYGASVFFPLIYAEKEARDIEKYFKTSVLLDGTHATLDSVRSKLGSSQVIHFATHAFADTTFDAFSGILLSMSADSTDDGLLMGYEVSELDLNASLVALSACETGNGRIISGEGIMGLPRLFIRSGAKSVLSSLWKIDDRFSSRFMPLFYKYLVEDGYTKSEALNKTKIDFIKSDMQGNIYYQHPFFWAAFNLYGEPGKLSVSSFSGIKITLLLLAIFLIIILVSLRIYKKYALK